MFSCPLHNWGSHDYPCPACQVTVTTTVASYTTPISVGESSLRDALKELVELKDIKDTQGKTEEYERRRPLAWEAARKVLSGAKEDQNTELLVTLECALEFSEFVQWAGFNWHNNEQKWYYSPTDSWQSTFELFQEFLKRHPLYFILNTP